MKAQNAKTIRTAEAQPKLSGSYKKERSLFSMSHFLTSQVFVFFFVVTAYPQFLLFLFIRQLTDPDPNPLGNKLPDKKKMPGI